MKVARDRLADERGGLLRERLPDHAEEARLGDEHDAIDGILCARVVETLGELTREDLRIVKVRVFVPCVCRRARAEAGDAMAIGVDLLIHETPFGVVEGLEELERAPSVCRRE